MREILVRTISGAFYISIIILSMFISREWFVSLFFILAVITLSEFLKLVRLTSYLAYVLLAIAFYFFSYKIIYTNGIHLFLLLGCFVNLFLFKDILWTSKIPMFEKKKYITVIFYIISGFVFLTLIPVLSQERPEMLLAVFVLIWSNDTFAYLVGSKFGKHKLLERISPKKTIEGFFGGLAGALIASVVVFYYIDHLSIWAWLTLAVIASVFGTIGDLIQSKFKRQAGVKDSGVLMPGHGGLYDRLDSIIYASPFLYAFLLLMDYVS